MVTDMATADGTTTIAAGAGLRAGVLASVGVMAAGAGALAGITGTAAAGAGEDIHIMADITHTMDTTITIMVTTMDIMAIADLVLTTKEEETTTIMEETVPATTIVERMLTAAEEILMQMLVQEAYITTGITLPAAEAILTAETIQA